ncbi:MAG: ABC transporter permease [candidate division NC10 bacterium]|nr:ABC transporter permease [candidate division NC10 bacterium]
MRSRFLLRLLQRSLANRFSRWLIALLAVALGASLVSASLTLATGMRAKMQQALRTYGANLLVVPAAAPTDPGGAALFATMPEEVLGKLNALRRTIPLLGYAPLLYTVAEIGSHRVAVVGTWPDAMRRVNPWWRVEGGWIQDRVEEAEAIIGASVAERLGLGVSAPLTLSVRGRSRTFRVVGIVKTGGSEDEQVVVSLRAAQELTDRRGQLNLIQASALVGDGRVEDVAQALEAGLPGVAVRTQLRLVLAEERILGRLSLLLGLLAGIVLIASALSVGAAMASSVLERRREIGLMKALGASRLRVGAVFLAEAGAIGLAGGLLGGVTGVGLAQGIAHSVFGTGVPPTVLPPLTAALVGAGVAGLASLIPVRRATAIQPGIVLRGD